MNTNYGLSDYLMFEEKDIKALRKRNKFNQDFSDFYSGFWDYEKQGYEMSAVVLNEAYRLCAKAILDKDPNDDIKFNYINDAKNKLSGCGDERMYCFSLKVMHLLLTEYCRQKYEKQGINCSELKAFCNGLYSKSKMDNDFAIFLGWWDESGGFETLDQTAKEMDIIDLLQIRPSLKMSFTRQQWPIQMAAATEDFDQDVIREIISRYPTIDLQLWMLNIIRNIASGKNVNGEDDDDLPF